MSLAGCFHEQYLLITGEMVKQSLVIDSSISQIITTYLWAICLDQIWLCV